MTERFGRASLPHRLDLARAILFFGVAATGCADLVGIGELTLKQHTKTLDGGDLDGGAIESELTPEASDGVDRSEPSLSMDGAVFVDSSDAGVSITEASVATDAAENESAPDAGRRAIDGKLVDGWGHPLASVSVLLGATSTITKGDGTFSVPDVVGPYDVRFIAPDGTRWAYVGLTRANPILSAYPARNRYQDLEGQAIGIASPLTQYLHFAWAFASSDGIGFGSALPGDTPKYSQSSIYWTGQATTSGTLYGLGWEAAPAPQAAHALPARYLGFASAPLTLQDRKQLTAPVLNLASTAVSDEMVSGTIATDGAALSAKQLYAVFGSGAAIPIIDDNTSDFAFAYHAPVLTDETVTIAALTGTFSSAHAFAVAHKSKIAPGSSGVALTVPSESKGTLPGSGATDVDLNTQFKWFAPTNHIYILTVFLPINDFDSTQYFVVTANPAVHIPDFSAAGLPLPVGAGGYWWVESHGPWNSIDEATIDGSLLDPFSRGQLLGRDRDGFFTRSEPVALKTK